MPTDLRTILRSRPINLILDWDGTLTRKDTLNFIGDIGYQHQKNHAAGTDQPKLPPWSHFANAWLEDFSVHQAQYTPAANSRHTIREERAWLASLAPIETCSVKRVEASGLFKGVNKQSVDAVAKAAVCSGELQLRKGWQQLFLRMLKGRHPLGNNSSRLISILSVNWSQTFIRLALQHAARACDELADAGQTENLIEAIEPLSVQANEITGLGDLDGSDGSLTQDGEAGIRTSADKLARIPLNCQHRLNSENSYAGSVIDSKNDADDKEPIVVYVGDSATDLESLVAADVGVCVRDEPMGSTQRELAETLSRIGVEVLHLNEEAVRTDGQKVVYWARDLQEIADLLPAVSI